MNVTDNWHTQNKGYVVDNPAFVLCHIVNAVSYPVVCFIAVKHTAHGAPSMLKTVMKPCCKGHSGHRVTPRRPSKCVAPVHVDSSALPWAFLRSGSSSDSCTKRPADFSGLENSRPSLWEFPIGVRRIQNRHTHGYTHIFIIYIAVIVSLFSLC